MAYYTENDIYESVTRDYLQSLDMQNVPSHKEIEKQLLSLFSDEIEVLNISRPKNGKIRIPKVLPASVIADIILKLYHVRKIVWCSDYDSGELFIYSDSGENEGLYVNNEDFISRIVWSFHYTALKKDVQEVYCCLTARASVDHVNDNPDLIPVHNGIFNYKTKKLMPFSPEYIFTSKSAIDYNPNARNVVIHNDEDNTDWDADTWINELSDDKEIVDLLWQVIGAAVRPYVSWEKVVCFYSEKGNNGKGTLCQLIRNLCGENATTSMAFDEFDDDFAFEPLVKASAIITDENITRAYIKATATLKAIITNDKFRVRRKFKSTMTIRFNGLMIQCINGLPKFGDKSESLYRRLLIVPFDKCFTGVQRKYIKDDYIKRKDVLEYVLYKVLNMNYYSFDVPERCTTELIEYKLFNDPVRDFLDEFMDEFKWTLVPYAFLYDLYKAWFHDNHPNSQPQNKKTFSYDVKAVISEYKDWYAKDDPVATNHRMDAREPLITRYGLTKWYSNYKGNDDAKLCDFVRKASYRGIVKD